MRFSMRFSPGSVRVFRVLFVMSVVAFVSQDVRAQTNTGSSFPGNPPVGIGTQAVFPDTPMSALHIHYSTATPPITWPAILRLSEGAHSNSSYFGILGLMLNHDTTFTSFPNQRDLILHENTEGDLILTNLSSVPGTGAIRFGTTGDSTTRSIPPPAYKHDLERLTIAPNGNIGIDMPPDSATGLCIPMEQFQIGGGSKLSPYITLPRPGLTIYGGNRFEGMTKPGGGIFRTDYRNISYNVYQDHVTGVASRFDSIGSSSIQFYDDNDGMVQLQAIPFISGHPLTDLSHGLYLQLGGNHLDLSTFDSTQYHSLFEVRKPGYSTWPAFRNLNGLFFHHTPVYIGIDSGANLTPNFTNIIGLNPDIGDDSTWMLAVNGAALMKELFIDDSDWPDYVFRPDYKLIPLGQVESFVAANHHLPDIPSAKQMAKTGIPVGRTEAAITKQLEETMLYVAQLSHKIESLEAEVEELKNKKER